MYFQYLNILKHIQIIHAKFFGPIFSVIVAYTSTHSTPACGGSVYCKHRMFDTMNKVQSALLVLY